MKIEIEVSDLELFAKAFNNAAAALGDIVSSIQFEMEPQVNSNRFGALKKLSNKELADRANCMIDVYYQILEIEKDVKKYDKRRENHEKNA